MSLPSAYTSLLNELNRDILRSTPSDPLQFCASWFAQRLEQDRIRARAGQPNPISPQPSLIGYTSSDNQPVYSTHPTAYSGLPQIATYSPQPIPTIGYSHLSPSFTSAYPIISSHPTHPLHAQTYHPYQQPIQYVSAVHPAHSHSIYSAQAQQPYDSNPPLLNGVSYQHNQPISQPVSHEEHSAYSFGRPTPSHPPQTMASTDHAQQTRQSLNQIPHQTSPRRQNPQTSSRHVSTSNLRQPPLAANTSVFPAHPEVSPRAAATPAPAIRHKRDDDDDDDDDEEDNSDGSDESSAEPMVPTGYNFGRRTSVSAESLSPSNLENGAALPKVVIPKTAEQRMRIEASIRENLLFRNLDEEQYNDVLNAMSEVRVGLGTEVIVQGAVGDFFYVVEEGTFDVYVRGPPTYTYVPPLPNQQTGSLSLPPGSGTGTSQFGQANKPGEPDANAGPYIQRAPTPGGTTVTHQAPSKKVHCYGPGGSFGELALMYNAPRAATVVATSNTATLWALDRVTFRSILMEHTSRKRKMYENFLSEVPILVSLTPVERSKIADSLEERTINEGAAVVKEGEVGREFYIIESGRAEVTKLRPNGGQEVVGMLGKGDYFGELALLNSAPRAATVRAASGAGRLRVAALGEKAFTRLLGPVIDILSRHAESHYGSSVIRRDKPQANGGGHHTALGIGPAPDDGTVHSRSVSGSVRAAGMPTPTRATPGSSSSNHPFGNWAGLSNPSRSPQGSPRPSAEAVGAEA